MNEISKYVEYYLREIQGIDFSIVSPREKDYWISYIQKTLDAPLSSAGVTRQEDWQNGWNECLKKDSAIPGYFGKYPVIRLDQNFVKSDEPNFEYYSLCGLQKWLFSKYLKDISNVYEFGCGTGHNLTRVRSINNEAHLYGLDWVDSSIQNVNKMKSILDPVDGIKFDMFHPDYDVQIKSDSAILTVASMEQLGGSFYNFTKFLITKKPKIVIHIEPIKELLDPYNLMDYLSIKYMEKRRYLNGYLEDLQYLEKRGDIKIVEATRSYVGSLFIDGYSVVIWYPI